MSNNTTIDATRVGLVLAAAQKLLGANNTVTTLEIKTELRKTHSQFYWTQDVVSKCMDDFSSQGAFSYTDNGTFRTYSDPTKKPAARVAKPKPTKAAAKSVAKSTRKWAATKSMSRSKAEKRMCNNKGHFFTVVFTKLTDGTERTMNCQYLPGQTTGTGYIKVKEASLVRAKDPNPIRQFDLSTVKFLSIGGETYKIR